MSGDFASLAIARTFFGDLSEDEAAAIAGATTGMTGADFFGIAKEVRRKARKAGAPVDAESVMSCLPPAIPLVSYERRLVCVHEAGHAVVRLVTGHSVLETVFVANEIRHQIGVVGSAVFKTGTTVLRSRQFYLDEICVHLAGIAAEHVLGQTMTDGGGGSEEADLAAASDVATLMVAQFGMGETLRYFRASTRAERDRLRRSLSDVASEVSRILVQQHERACAIIREHAPIIEELAAKLEQRGFVMGTEVQQMMLPSNDGEGVRPMIDNWKLVVRTHKASRFPDGRALVEKTILEAVLSTLIIWGRDADMPVESSWPQECMIDTVREVGGAHDDDPRCRYLAS